MRVDAIVGVIPAKERWAKRTIKTAKRNQTAHLSQVTMNGTTKRYLIRFSAKYKYITVLFKN